MSSEMASQELKNLNIGNGEYFGPDDELPEDVKLQCVTNARKNLNDSGGYDRVLNLEKDDVDLREPGQEIALISFVGPYTSLKAKYKDLYFNVRGACESVDDTRSRLTEIQKITKKYDVYTFEMYTWIAIPPNPEFMDSNDAHEDYLNKLIISHKLKLEVDKEMYEARKRLMGNNPDLNVHSEGMVEIEDSKETEDSENKDVETVTEVEISKPETITKIDSESFATHNCVKEQKFESKEKLDECKSEGQEWAVISIVGNNELGHALKIKGFYEKEEDARTKTKELSEIDPTYNNYVVETYRWLNADISPDDIEDQVYDNEELNSMNQEHKKGKNKAMKHLKQNPPESTPAPMITATTSLDDMENAPVIIRGKAEDKII